MQSRTLKVFLTLAIAAGGIAFLLKSSISEAEYYKHVDELFADVARWESRTLRVHGFVKAGSLVESIEGQKTRRSFILEYNGQEIPVHHVGPKPDNFRDLAEVVAKGTVRKQDGSYIVDATELSAKCPSKYEGAERTKDYGGEAPKPNTPIVPAKPSQSQQYGDR